MRLDWLGAGAGCGVQKFLVQKHLREFTWFSPVPFSDQEIELHSNDRAPATIAEQPYSEAAIDFRRRSGLWGQR